MPWKNPKQATKILMEIKRKQGSEAASAFGREHRGELKRRRKPRPYKPRRK